MVARRSVPRTAPAAVSARPIDGPPEADGGFGVDDLADFDDLPDAVVGTDEEFLAAVGAAAPPTPRPARKGRRRDPRQPRPPASAGAAAEVLERQREEAGYGSHPLPPRRRSKARADRGAAAPSPDRGSSLNAIVLLTVLAVPAVGFAVFRGAVGHRSTDREWRQAFGELDGLMNEFAAVSGASEVTWSAWAREFEQARPALEHLVERAPRGTAGYEIGQAITTMGNAVRMRAGGERGPALRFLVNQAADHAAAAAVKLGFDRKMERPG